MMVSSESDRTCYRKRTPDCETCAPASAATITPWESYFCRAATSLPVRHVHQISDVVCVVTRLSVPPPMSSSAKPSSEVWVYKRAACILSGVVTAACPVEMLLSQSVSSAVHLYSVLVSVSVFRALSTLFHSINSPNNSLLSHSVLLDLFLLCWSFQLYIFLWKVSCGPDVIPGWLGLKHQLTN